MQRLPRVFAAAGLLGLAALPAFAAPSAADRDFMQKAAVGGLAEVQTAQLAQQRAGSPAIKEFAQRMIADHTQANTELQQLARQQSVTLPARPDAKEAAAEHRLTGLNGAAFDKAYVQQELQDHQQTVALFQKQASTGQDPALKAFAQKTLPTLQQHLQMVQALNTAR
ncbi:MAG: DUF4142 domain-containing protein [Acetobacteraceae bacterium]